MTMESKRHTCGITQKANKNDSLANSNKHSLTTLQINHWQQ